MCPPMKPLPSSESSRSLVAGFWRVSFARIQLFIFPGEKVCSLLPPSLEFLEVRRRPPLSWVLV